MRDIDFDELDKAVNRFLGKPEKVENLEETSGDINKPKEDLNGVSKTDNNIVFSHRPAIDAVEFHTNLMERRFDRKKDNRSSAPKAKIFNSTSLDSDSVNKETDDKPEVIQVKIKKSSQQLKDNFSEKTCREHKKKTIGILDNFEKARFEEPVLDDFSDIFTKKTTVDPPVIYQPAEVKKVMPELESKFQDKLFSSLALEKNIEASLPAGELAPDQSVKAINVRNLTPRLTVPDRPGVFEIKENDELKVFGAKKPVTQTIIIEEKVESDTKPEEKMSNLEQFQSEMSIVVPQINSEMSKKSNALENKSEVLVKVAETENNVDNKEIQASQSSKELDQTIQTPFLHNAKIEKRPLGAVSLSAKQVSNFDIKRSGRKREMQHAKIKNDNQKPVVPILNRDEYSEPVIPRKKKSGWGVVFAIMIMLVLGGVAGFAAFVLLNM